MLHLQQKAAWSLWLSELVRCSLQNHLGWVTNKVGRLCHARRKAKVGLVALGSQTGSFSKRVPRLIGEYVGTSGISNISTSSRHLNRKWLSNVVNILHMRRKDPKNFARDFGCAAVAGIEIFPAPVTWYEPTWSAYHESKSREMTAIANFLKLCIIVQSWSRIIAWSISKVTSMSRKLFHHLWFCFLFAELLSCIFPTDVTRNANHWSVSRSQRSGSQPDVQ